MSTFCEAHTRSIWPASSFRVRKWKGWSILPILEFLKRGYRCGMRVKVLTRWRKNSLELNLLVWEEKNPSDAEKITFWAFIHLIWQWTLNKLLAHKKINDQCNSQFIFRRRCFHYTLNECLLLTKSLHYVNRLLVPEYTVLSFRAPCRFHVTADIRTWATHHIRGSTLKNNAIYNLTMVRSSQRTS